MRSFDGVGPAAASSLAQPPLLSIILYLLRRSPRKILQFLRKSAGNWLARMWEAATEGKRTTKQRKVSKPRGKGRTGDPKSSQTSVSIRREEFQPIHLKPFQARARAGALSRPPSAFPSGIGGPESSCPAQAGVPDTRRRRCLDNGRSRHRSREHHDVEQAPSKGLLVENGILYLSLSPPPQDQGKRAGNSQP